MIREWLKGEADAKESMKTLGQTDMMLSILNRLSEDQQTNHWTRRQWKRYREGYLSVIDF